MTQHHLTISTNCNHGRMVEIPCDLIGQQEPREVLRERLGSIVSYLIMVNSLMPLLHFRAVARHEAAEWRTKLQCLNERLVSPVSFSDAEQATPLPHLIAFIMQGRVSEEKAWRAVEHLEHEADSKDLKKIRTST